MSTDGLVATLGCGCSCHRWPGVKHMVACCDAPPYESQQEKDDRTNVLINELAEAVDIVSQVLTALERSSPAEPGYGEIEYRQRVMAQGMDWLKRARG